MTRRLHQKVAIIAGAGSGIGRAAALTFAAEGAAVVVAELDEASGRATERAVQSAGGEAVFVETDVRSESSIERVVGETTVHYGRLHVLLNCAGGSQPGDGPIDEVTIDVLDATLSVDLRGAMLLSRAAIPLIASSGGGSIINMASYVAIGGRGDDHAYIAAKGGIISLTRAMAAAYAAKAIRVNAIAPGVVLTDRVRRRIEEADVDIGALRERYPFGVGSPDDIAGIALFLASSDSRMVNGCILPADGGLSVF